MPSPYQLTSVRISPFCELARWVLERHGILYDESCHTPIWNVPYTKAAGDTVNVPVIQAPDATFQIAEFLTYLDARSRADDKLFPTGPAQRAESDAFIKEILTGLAIAIRMYAYANMLPNAKVTGPLMTTRSPWWEKAAVTLFYPMQANAMRKVLKVSPEAIEQTRTHILTSFNTISQRLRTTNGYLFGDKLTVADLVFAAGTAPITLPPEYGAPFPSFADSPQPMQSTVLAVQATPAGQHALRVYRESRITPYDPAKTSGNTGLTWKDRLKRFISRVIGHPTILRLACKVLRLKPILKLGKLTVVSTYDEVRKVLNAPDDYTVEPINAFRMDLISGPFILGMDRSEQYDRENDAIRRIVKPTDLEWIRLIVAGTAEKLIEVSKPYGRIDVSSSYTRVSAARVVAEYFGVPGPSERILMQWSRALFWDVFLNRADDLLVRRAADNAAAELRAYLTNLIAQRMAEGAPGDDFLSRLIRSGALDPDGVRRNITGILVGAIDTTVTAAANIFSVLLEKPEALALTRQAAQSGDLHALRQCVYEALRFNPQAPALLRHVKADGTTAVLMAIGAMFDPAAFPQPDRFLTGRPMDRYILFGGGMHTCYGVMINGVQLPELVRQIIALPNLRRAPGRYAPTLYEGPFPDRLVVQFGDPALAASTK